MNTYKQRQISEMDAKEYLKMITPEGKKSKLTPWLSDLIELKKAGCSTAQLQDFLKKNNVTASISAIQKYLWRMSDQYESGGQKSDTVKTEKQQTEILKTPNERFSNLTKMRKNDEDSDD